MTATAANVSIPTQGILIKYGTAGTTPATLLGSIKDIPELPSIKVDELDITRIDQADMVKQFAGTLIDTGMLKLVTALIKAQVATCYGLVKIQKSWSITFPDGSVLGFDGWLKEITPEAKTAGEALFGLTIRSTGNVVFTPAA